MQVGCVHTCQELEFYYCGVIIGNDISIDENNNIYAIYDNNFDFASKVILEDQIHCH